MEASAVEVVEVMEVETVLTIIEEVISHFTKKKNQTKFLTVFFQEAEILEAVVETLVIVEAVEAMEDNLVMEEDHMTILEKL